jgi:hypothetical protein
LPRKHWVWVDAALNGQVPNQFLLPIRNQIASSFQQSNQNLVDALGANGQAGSGIAAGPLANMQQQQGVATGNATLQALVARARHRLSRV